MSTSPQTLTAGLFYVMPLADGSTDTSAEDPAWPRAIKIRDHFRAYLDLPHN